MYRDIQLTHIHLVCSWPFRFCSIDDSSVGTMADSSVICPCWWNFRKHLDFLRHYCIAVVTAIRNMKLYKYHWEDSLYHNMLFVVWYAPYANEAGLELLSFFLEDLRLVDAELKTFSSISSGMLEKGDFVFSEMLHAAVIMLCCSDYVAKSFIPEHAMSLY